MNGGGNALPEGWTRHELGTQVYYYHAATNTTSHEIPTAAPVQQHSAGATTRMVPLLIEDNRDAVKAGGRIMEQNEDVFPDRRRCKDAIFGIAFVVAVGVLATMAYKETKGFKFNTKIEDENLPLKCMATALLASCISSCVFSFMFVHLTRMYTKEIVWVSLLLSPCLLIIAAIACLLWVPQPSNIIAAASFGLAGVCSLMCVFCCWRRMIPFTVEVLKPVAAVLGHKPSLMLVAVVGTVFAVAWSVLTFCAFLGIFQQMRAELNDNNRSTFYGLYFLTALIFAWGALVVQNVCHVTNCGVFGRWYFGITESVRSSLKVAMTNSFGSICLGSLIVAFVQACEATVRMMRKAAREEGNIVTCVVLCAVECFIACIREIVEAFTYFAYVQVAVRGLNFIDSAKVTFALCKFKNIFYLVSVSLVGNVVFLGSLLCGILSGIVAFGVGYTTAPKDLTPETLNGTLAFNFIFGLFAGVVIAATILNVLRSGFATICVCWAEREDNLASRDRGLHTAFQQSIRLAEQ